jgi:hypothetical protein
MTRVVAFRKAIWLPLLVSVILLSWPVGARAQRITGELSGTVTDAQGGVIPGADVALANEASGATRRTVTNGDGFFAFAAVPAGTHTLTVKMPGFRTHEVTDIVLVGGDSRTVRTIRLELATVAETVSVRGGGADAAHLGREGGDADRRGDPGDAGGRHQRGRGPAHLSRDDPAHAG